MARSTLINYELEADRVSQWLDNNKAMKIQDRDSYDLVFNDTIAEKSESQLSFVEKRFRDLVFRTYRKENPQVLEERLFKKAKGRDLRRDQLKTAKRVVKTRRKFIKEGAREVDLKGFDTARQKFNKRIAKKRLFTIMARSKGKVVRAREIIITFKGKKLKRFRDRKGRFVSVK